MASPIRPHSPINNPEAEPIEEEADDNISSREWNYLSLNNLKWISSSSLRIPQGNPMPIYGSFSVKGPPLHRDDMWLVIENFCRPDIVSGQCLHFFAVYDSHCGSHVILSFVLLIRFLFLLYISYTKESAGVLAVQGSAAYDHN